jgi:hypothetical protein
MNLIVNLFQWNQSLTSGSFESSVLNVPTRKIYPRDIHSENVSMNLIP